MVPSQPKELQQHFAVFPPLPGLCDFNLFALSSAFHHLCDMSPGGFDKLSHRVFCSFLDFKLLTLQYFFAVF
jgi:hypothetical protein